MTDRELIEGEIRRFIAAYNAGDVAGVMRCYAGDLVKLRPGAPVEGKRETEARLADVMRAYAGELHVVNDEIVVSGDMTFARGTLRIVPTPRAGGEPQQVTRRFLEIWRKEGGRWVVARTMDSVV